MTWWTAFVLTQTVEMPVYLWGTRSAGYSWLWRLAIAFGTSAFTHPIVWYVLPVVRPSLGYWGYVVVAETFAVVAEALYLRALDVPRPWLLALVANASSVAIGFFLQWLEVL